MKRAFLNVVYIVLILIVAGAVVLWYRNHNKKASAVTFTTATVKKGNLTATIGATGTVEPEEVIDVGAQVAGRIIAFGKDKNGKSIDYGSEVEADMILAQIDDAIYKVDAAQAAAQLQLANAQVATAQANLEQYKARLDQAQRDWERAKKIGSSDALAVSAYDAYKTAYDVAKANVAVGEAAIHQAEAAVAQAKASESRAQMNLGYCVIKSPVNGVIIDRRVNIGQTVVASLNAPSLFLIAKDLKRMQVWIAVNEADIGSIKSGQTVTFTVDAYPGEVFKGTVGKVRLNATMTQNVVTYTVEVVTDNSSGKLLPYLTANAQFEVDHRENVLTVPNAALRWAPQPQMISPDAKTKTAGSGQRPSGAGGRGGAAKDRGTDASTASKGTIWVQEGNYVKSVRVRTGISDGSMTEIVGGDLTEGAELVVSETIPARQNGGANSSSASAAGAGTTNPFAPQMPSRRR